MPRKAERGRRIHTSTRLTPALVALLALSAAAPGSGQVGLVLGGGGARGLAHVGAIAALEQLGYQPEIVVGTSMGAIIGGLYAAGWSADSIIVFIRRQDWPAVFSPLEQPISLERSPRQPIIELRLGGGAPETATGLVPDWRVNRLLVGLLFDAGARARGDFDRLPRRFRAIAANLATGRPVVIASGDLARAVRASMSVPAFFRPLVSGDTVLVDGGIASYLPVSVARDAGAATTLAVDVLRPPPVIESTEPIAVGLRGFRLTLENTLTGTAAPTFLILPAVPQAFSAAYFPRRPDPLLEAGRAAALRTLPAAVPARVDAPARLAAPERLAALRVDAADPALAGLALAAFRRVAPGEYDPRAVQRAVDRLYASGLAAGVWPRVEQTSDAAELIVAVDATPRTRLTGAIAFENDRGGFAWSAVRHRRAAAPVEFGVAAAFGTLEAHGSVEARGLVRSWVPLGWTIGAGYREIDLRLYEDTRRIGEREVARAGGWAGLEWRTLAPELFAALTFRADYVRDEGGPKGAAIGPHVRVIGTGRPARIVGIRPLLEGGLRFGDLAYSHGRLRGSIDREWGHVLVAVGGEANATAGTAPADVLPALGDDHVVPGLRWGRERAAAAAAGGIDVAYPIFFDGYVRLRTRAGFAAESLNAATDANWITGAQLAGVWYSPAGPVELGVGSTDRGDWRIDFSVGSRF